MPRLLLVDDNPSIHRIAESLLVGSSVELVCVDSAEQAIQKLDGGESFDIALIDTVMPGMDGWQLLDRIRATPATAKMPVAMMAGVLDPVDPGRLDTAPIQGFLKKPIELRDLNDRVQTILAQAGPSPFATVPGAKLEGWTSGGDRDVSMFDVPGYEPEAAAEEEEGDSDLLILRAEDLLEEEEAAAAPVPVPPPAPLPELELEELDVASIKGLPAPAAASMMEAPPMPALELPPMPVMEPPPAAMMEAHAEMAAPPTPVMPEPAPEVAEELGLGDLGELAEPVLPAIHSVDLGARPAALPAPSFQLPEAAPAPAPPLEAPAAASSAMGPAATLDPDTLARAIAADPALLDALVKAVVARAGDKVLREIAWELMPELAAKLKP